MDNHIPIRKPDVPGWVALAFIGIGAWLKELENRWNLEQRLERQKAKILSQGKRVRQLKADLSQLWIIRIILIRKAFGYLAELADTYLTTRNADLVFRKTAGLVREINADPETLSQLFEFLDEYLDGLVSQLRNDYPKLKEDDIVLFCYNVIGCKPSLINLLMKPGKVEDLYARKSRLKQKIARRGPARAEKYLDLLD